MPTSEKKELTLEEMLLETLHLCSWKNKEFLNNNHYNLCGCFYCRKTFEPSEIKEYVDEENTAICPRCGIDSVIPVRRDVDNEKVLESMSKYWFDRRLR